MQRLAHVSQQMALNYSAWLTCEYFKTILSPMKIKAHTYVRDGHTDAVKSCHSSQLCIAIHFLESWNECSLSIRTYMYNMYVAKSVYVPV